MAKQISSMAKQLSWLPGNHVLHSRGFVGNVLAGCSFRTSFVGFRPDYHFRSALKMSLCVEFRADEITSDDVAVEAATGKAYLHKHLDVNGRPVIVVKVQKHITGNILCVG